MASLSKLARSSLRRFPVLKPLAWQIVRRVPRLRAIVYNESPHALLIAAIAGGQDLNAAAILSLAEEVENRLRTDLTLDRVSIHREIGRAIFGQSERLYNGEGLPAALKRFTYPPFLSVALSSHCNAACFFCRTPEFKGTSILFEQIKKLESAIRNARVVDLTGWGEPFFYPRFEEVVEYILAVNRDTPQLIQVTSNGSFLSERWGKLLSGRLNRLVISMNAAESETYDRQMLYKNKRFTLDATIERIREFCSVLTDIDKQRIVLHIVANTENYTEITQLVRIAHELGVPSVNVGNFICADAAHIDKTLWHVKQEYNDELARAQALGVELGVSVHGRKFFVEEFEVKGAATCLAPFEQFFVEMLGTTSPCCFMGHERTGNVYDHGFEAVWFSDIMNNLRADRFLPPCKVCTIFTPFDSKVSHISAHLTTDAAGNLTDHASPAPAVN